MKTRTDMAFFGFAQNCKPEFQRTKEYFLKSSLRSFSTASRSASANSTHASFSYDAFQNTSMGSLMSESSPGSSLDFYIKGKTEIDSIRQEFDRIRTLNKKTRKITFGATESATSRIGHIMASISKRINDCESAVKENGAIFSIDKSPKVKAMVAAMQGHLGFELGKVKRQFKALAQDIADKKRDSHPIFVDNSKFSFISESDEQGSVIYDSTGNVVRYEEVNCDDQSQYEHIYKNIVELGRIMRDIEEASLDQGCLVDRIDINISATLTTAKKANFDLIAADQMLRKDLGDKVMKWLLVVNLVVFVALILKVFQPWK